MITKKQETVQRGVLTLAHKDHEKSLNLHAFFKVNDHALGEDMVQSVFMKTWKYMLKGGKIHMMKSFLFHILNGLIIDEYRKKKTTSLDSLLEKGYEPGEDENQRILNAFDGKSASILINNLPKKYREIMKMRYTEDMTITEMSKRTGKTKNSVAVQIHRGLKKLKHLYEHQLD